MIARFVKDGQAHLKLVGHGRPVALDQAEGEAEFVSFDYVDQSLVGYDQSGEIHYRSPVGGRLTDLSYQSGADRLCFRRGDQIRVVAASTGEAVATITPRGLESLSDLVALDDGRFAVNTRNQENTGVITTFDPDQPDQVASATLGFLPLEMEASEGGLVVAQRTGHLAVVRNDQVLFESDRIISHGLCQSEGKLWCLEGLPNRYHGDRAALVSIDAASGEVRSYPFEGRGYQLFRHDSGPFLVQESGQGRRLRFRWLEPGQPVGPLWELEGTQFQQVHLDDAGQMYVVTREDHHQRVFQVSPGEPPRLLAEEEGAQFLTLAVTDRGLMTFSSNRVTHLESGQQFADLTALVDALGVPEVRSRQFPALASMASQREARVDELFAEVLRWTDQPNPLAGVALEGEVLKAGGSLNLALTGSDAQAVTEELLRLTDETRRRLVLDSSLLHPVSTRWKGLDGYQVERGENRIVIHGPDFEKPIHFGKNAFVTCLVPFLSQDGQPHLAAGASDGTLVWSQAHPVGKTYRLEMGAAVAAVEPHPEGGLLAVAANGAVVHLEDTALLQEAEPPDPVQEIFQEEDFLIIGDTQIEIQH